MNDLIKKGFPFLKKYWMLPAIVFLGIGLMILPQSRKEREAAETVSYFNEKKYVEETETMLLKMISAIDGAGRCGVTVSLSGGMTNNYVTENGTVLVVKDQNGNQTPILSHSDYPEIAGVTVVSSGAGDPAVRAEIVRAVSTVLDIGTNKVCVVTLDEG